GIINKTFTTGKYKNPYPIGDEITDENNALMNEYMQNTCNIFKEMVLKNRKLEESDERVTEIMSAKVWYAKQAKELNLVDEIMMTNDYIEMLVKDKNTVFFARKIKKST